MFQHEHVLVHKAVKKLECPAQNLDLISTEHLGDELEHQLHPSLSCSLTVTDLSNVFVDEWANFHIHVSKEVIIIAMIKLNQMLKIHIAI